jgi:hypothetical protein
MKLGFVSDSLGSLSFDDLLDQAVPLEVRSPTRSGSAASSRSPSMRTATRCTPSQGAQITRRLGESLAFIRATLSVVPEPREG